MEKTTHRVKENIFEPFFTEDMRYLNYAAAYGSIKCFKYLLLNEEKIDFRTFEMSIIGGNNELIRIVDNEKYESQTSNNLLRMKKNEFFVSNNPITCALSIAIKLHRNDLVDWILEQKFSMKNQNNDLISLIYCSIKNENLHALVALIDYGCDFNSCQKEYSNFLEIASIIEI